MRPLYVAICSPNKPVLWVSWGHLHAALTPAVAAKAALATATLTLSLSLIHI